MAKHNLFSMADEAKRGNHSTTYSREELLELFILENMSQQDMEKHLKRVSMEYESIDVPILMFGSLTMVYRHFFNKTRVRRENLQYLTELFLGKWSGWELELKREENIYYVLIIDSKKVDINNPDYYNSLADKSLKLLQGLISVCKPCAPRKATQKELAHLKKFNPKKLHTELTMGIARLEASSKQLDKAKQAKWATVVGKLTKFVNMATNTIKDGLHVDDITQK